MSDTYSEFKLWLKTRPLLWWWIIKYRGKRNIPPQVLFDKIEETMSSLSSSINEAIEMDVEVQSEEERLLARDIYPKIRTLREGIDEIKQ